MKKIYITGCAKTGTTLLRRLFNAFDLKVYNKDEIKLINFLKSDFNVGKRTIKTMFSTILNEQEIEKQLPLLKNIHIVNMVRNKEDVLLSDNNYVNESRYDACMNQAFKYKNYIDLTVKYEELITDPNKVQENIKSLFNLKSKYLFSEYPSFVNINEENITTHNGIYKLRKIGEDK